jgi:hypothetical protein
VKLLKCTLREAILLNALLPFGLCDLSRKAAIEFTLLPVSIGQKHVDGQDGLASQFGSLVVNLASQRSSTEIWQLLSTFVC